MRVAVLSSFNVDLLPRKLEKALKKAGLSTPEVVTGEFGQIALEALNPESRVLSPSPDAVVVIPAVDDASDVWDLQDAVYALLERTNGTIYVVVFGTDRLQNAHILNPACDLRGQRKVESFLGAIRNLSTSRVVLVDWDWHRRGCDYFDSRLWYLARMRLNPKGLEVLSDLISVHFAANAGIVRKVLAVDLDNTVWGGILGEDGFSGIVISEDEIGLAYQDFQRELLAIRATGVLLVACSKNNEEEALAVFDNHPEMILDREHFSALRINWNNKADNLVEIADELGLGLDSFVFIDDDPYERDFIRQTLPEVIVPELPEDPAFRPRFLRDLTLFRRISLTSEDVERPIAYRAQTERKQMGTSLSLEDYIESLEQKIDIRPVDEGTLARAAQLCQRTNQFTTTTSRYTVTEIEQMFKDPNVEMFTVSVSDRFGDSGITGLAITKGELIDTFLLSCRVLGRGIEDALLEFLVTKAKEKGLDRIVGIYVPTNKNAPAAKFYSNAGFAPLTTDRFVLELVCHA